MLRRILFGGPHTTRLNQEDEKTVHFKKNVLVLLVLGTALYASAPLMFIPSRLGCIPYEYGDFREMNRLEQYQYVLRHNLTILVKFVRPLDEHAKRTLPRPPEDSLWSEFVFVALFVVDGLCVVGLSIGIKRLFQNLGKAYC